METGTGSSQASATLPRTGSEAVFAILFAASFSHLLNDTIQSLIPAIYPVLKDSFQLNFAQIGLITLTFQITASMLQPVAGLYTDRRPQPFSLAIGMGFSLVGLILLSVASSYWMILGASALVGLGSSVFYPEASRLARMASGGRYGFAKSLFAGKSRLGFRSLLRFRVRNGRDRVRSTRATNRSHQYSIRIPALRFLAAVRPVYGFLA
jgi:MFS transporter, FSR family, fosmidomycin resistance protein